MEDEAVDPLTNEKLHHFRAERRIQVDLEKLDFIVMSELFSEGKKYVKELKGLRASEQQARKSGAAQAAKRAKGDRLAQRDP